MLKLTEPSSAAHFHEIQTMHSDYIETMTGSNPVSHEN